MFRLFKSAILILFLLPFSVFAQQSSAKDAFISDALFVYLHSGPNNQYRIVGTLNAGQSITYLSEDSDTGYAQIQYDGNKTAWLPKQFISYQPGLVAQLDALKTSYATHDSQINALEQQRNELDQQLNQALAEQQKLQQQLQQTNLLNTQLQQRLDSTQSSVWQDPMVLGAAILIAGLLFGLLLPLLWPKKRGNDRWM